MKENVETLIVGGGIAGLACALSLQKKGKEFLLIEKADRFGGRIKTDKVKEFQFDHGFQVLNPGYRQAKSLLNLKDLKLNYFDAGFAIRDENKLRTIRDPFRHPEKIFTTIFNLPGTISQKYSFIKYLTKILLSTQAARQKFPDVTAKVALVEAGIDEEFLMKVIRPFLNGVFLESELQTSRIFLDEVLVSFFSGTPALPERGMEAIVEQLAAPLAPSQFRLNESARKVEPGKVTTDAGEIQAKNIVLATDVQVATQLLNLPNQKVHKVKTWYLIANQDKSEILSGQKLLLTDANPQAPLVNSVVISNVAPSYAPPNTALISASAIEQNTRLNHQELLNYLSSLYQLSTKKWQIVADYEILNALPAMYFPFNPNKEIQVAVGLFAIGDHRNFSSIQGALASGVQAAKEIIKLG